MSIDVLISLPHANPAFNDVAALPIGQLLTGLLRDADYRVESYAMLLDRIHVDANRREARGTVFRQEILRRVQSGVRLLIDLHSFPAVGGSGRFTGRDIVLLHTPGAQDYAFLKRYRGLLEDAATALKWPARIEIQKSERINDICIEAVENGQPTTANLLAEHNEAGDEIQFASLHFHAIQRLLGRPLVGAR